MKKNNFSFNRTKDRLVGKLKGALIFLSRWFFIILIFSAAIFCSLVWHNFILKGDWDDFRKQNYIKEKAQLSFDKEGYQKIIEMMNARRDRLENFSPYTGRDIFSPEGF